MPPRRRTPEPFHSYLLLWLLSASLIGCTPAVQVQRPLAPPPWQEPAGYVPGNRVELLADGPEAFSRIYRAIAAARRHIHVETYILCEDAVGRRFIDALAARRQAGVEVRLIFDNHGTAPCTSTEFLLNLDRLGIEWMVYRPPSDDGLIYPLRYNRRDHRKLLIVDGRVAFTGGINFDAAYSSKPRLSRDPDEGWRDTNVRVEGPAVAQFQKLFVERWRRHRPLPELPGQALFPALAPTGQAAIKVVSSTGGQAPNEVFADYLATITGARTRVWLTHSYFMPEPQLMQALTAAARRGVDVRLVVPGFSDVLLLHPIARSSYGRLLRAGVRIYERSDAFVHAKTAVVDGVWSTVGSTNLDYRSLVHNDEVNAMILDPDLAGRMEALFRQDVRHARRVTQEDWNGRPFSERAVEWLGLIFAYWL